MISTDKEKDNTMNKECKKKIDVRDYVMHRKFKMFLYRLFNTAVLLALTAVAGFLLRKVQGSDCIPLKWGVAAFYYLNVLILIGWLFSIFSFMLRKAVVGVICFAILFVWGSASYFMWHVDDDDSRDQVSAQVEAKAHGNSFSGFFQQQLEAPNRAISAFFPSRGGFEHIDRRHRFHYFVFHLLVIAFVAAVMFSHFGRGLVNRFKKRYVIRQGVMNVFWGVDDVGQMLARNIVETTPDQEVVFLLPDDVRFDEERFKEVVWQLDLIGAVWVLADLEHPSHSNVRGHRHFFLDESGHRNVSRANQLVAVMKKCGVRNPDGVYLYVRIEANEDEKIFFKWAENVKEYVTPIFIRESDMIAKRFIEVNPMLNCPHITINPEQATVSGSFRVLLLGLGTTGQSILREMVSNGQFKGTSGFSADVIEDNPAVVEAYKAQHEEAMREYGIKFVDNVKIEGSGFDVFLAKNMRLYNRIVVCLSGDVMNIRVASRIEHFVTPEGIGPDPDVLFVRVSDPNRRSYFDPKSGMKLFGDLRDVYSLATLDFDPIDTMAKILHGEWEKDKSAAGLTRAWHRASFNDQRSSRASALGERNLARILGFEVVAVSDERIAVKEEEFYAALAAAVGATTRETILAEDEHLRWNAYHRMLGYSCWDMKNPPLEQVPQKKANQLETLGKHACLVDFAALPDVDFAIACAVDPTAQGRLKPADFIGNVQAVIGGKQKSSLQAYDYMFVRKIWDNATAAGMKLVKV